MLKSDINNKPNNNSKKNSNSNSNRNNSNNKSNKQPSTRFNFVNDEPKVKVEPKVNTPTKKPNNDNVFIQKPKNDRFNMAKLTEEEPMSVLRNEYDTINRKPVTNLIHSVNPVIVIANNKPIENITDIMVDVKVEQFPELNLRLKNKTSVENINSNDNDNDNDNDSQNSYKKAIRHENVVVEDKSLIVKPGWVSIVKSEAGKSTIIYGPKTEYQKKVEYLRKNLNHQMCVAISNMEERWIRHEQIYNSLHGENAFNERYGYVPTCDLDDYDDYNHSDDDSDYEYETE
jgi:hypothetical protein